MDFSITTHGYELLYMVCSIPTHGFALLCRFSIIPSQLFSTYYIWFLIFQPFIFSISQHGSVLQYMISSITINCFLNSYTWFCTRIYGFLYFYMFYTPIYGSNIHKYCFYYSYSPLYAFSYSSARFRIPLLIFSIYVLLQSLYISFMTVIRR